MKLIHWLLLTITIMSFLRTLDETNKRPFGEKGIEWTLATAVLAFLTTLLFGLI